MVPAASASRQGETASRLDDAASDHVLCTRSGAASTNRARGKQDRSRAPTLYSRSKSHGGVIVPRRLSILRLDEPFEMSGSSNLLSRLVNCVLAHLGRPGRCPRLATPDHRRRIMVLRVPSGRDYGEQAGSWSAGVAGWCVGWVAGDLGVALGLAFAKAGPELAVAQVAVADRPVQRAGVQDQAG